MITEERIGTLISEIEVSARFYTAKEMPQWLTDCKSALRHYQELRRAAAWIKVEDRLPKEEGVCVFCKRGKVDHQQDGRCWPELPTRFSATVPVDVSAGIQIDMDGNQWFARRIPFTNLMEQEAGFGDTPNLALAELIAAESPSPLPAPSIEEKAE
jgi:hypothetical protein